MTADSRKKRFRDDISCALPNETDADKDRWFDVQEIREGVLESFRYNLSLQQLSEDERLYILLSIYDEIGEVELNLMTQEEELNHLQFINTVLPLAMEQIRNDEFNEIVDNIGDIENTEEEK